MTDTQNIVVPDAPGTTGGHDVPSTPGARPVFGPIARVVALSLALLALGAVLLVRCDCITEPAIAAPWWVAIVIGVGFALAERFVFHIEGRREAIAISLSEVPTAFALAFLEPVVAIPLRVLWAVGLMVVVYRPKPFKVLFNAALFTFETALAFTVLRLLVPVGDGLGGPFLVAVAVATTAATVAGVVVVAVAVSSVEGQLLRRLVGEAQNTLLIAPVSALIATVALAPALFGVGYALLALGPIVAVWLVLLHYGRLLQRHRDLTAVHDFTAVVGESLDVDEVAAVAVDEAVRLMRAEGGVLVVVAHDGCVSTQVSSGAPVDPAPTGPDVPGWDAACAPTSTSWWATAEDGTGRAGREVPTDRLVVPLRSGGRFIGLLVLARRAGLTGVFQRGDLRRADAMGAQLSIALDKALLHAEMEHAAMHDPLTGRANRATFERAVTDALAERRVAGTGHEEAVAAEAGGAVGVLAVLMLDLDQFKDVNDTLGHHVGDQVLFEFAARIHGVIEPDDAFARFGGDEFALFVRRRDEAEVRRLADRVLSAAHAPLALDGYDVVVTVSIGIAVATAEDRDADALVRRADIAMYAAKSEHAGFEMYREEIDRRTPQRLALLGDLREVLDVGGLEIHLQPKLDLDTSTVVGAEALARWQHPVRGWVPPDEFIRVAEETGLIRRLTDQVLMMSLRVAQSWAAAGHDLTVSVNLSTLDLLDELLPERVARRLEHHALAPDRLILEITESSLMADTPRTMSTVGRLHRLGVGLSLDDFGTGYSSLSYLRRLPVTELKIDRSFIANVALDAQDEVIVRSTIDLGHNLGLRVVAEGAENPTILERLRALGCDLGQGYAVARPMPPDAFEHWLATTAFGVRSDGRERTSAR